MNYANLHMTAKTNLKLNVGNAWFIAIITYIIVDYARPQDILPLSFLKPGAIVSIVLLYHLLMTNQKHKLYCHQGKILISFLLLLLIHIPLAVNTYNAYITVQSMFLICLYVFSVIVEISTLQKLRTLIKINLLIVVYVCIYALLHGGQGSGNYFQDENDLSLYINTFLPFYYFLFFHEDTTRAKASCLLAILLGLSTIVISFSRGGFVGLLAIVSICWLSTPRRLMSLVMIGIAATLIYFCAGDAYLKDMATSTNTDEGTAKERILSWKAAWRMFLDNPLGVGGNNFHVRFPEYQGDDFKKGMWGRVAHSLWFTLIPELGVPGILFYFALLYYNLKDVFYLVRLPFDTNLDLRYLHFIGLACLGSLAGYFVSATFLSVLYYPHYWYMTGVLVAARKVAEESIKQIRAGES